LEIALPRVGLRRAYGPTAKRRKDAPRIVAVVLARLLTDAGWALARINGSHHVFTREGSAPISIPVHQKR
jgi:predicted RNA binding protein YcfA (HicA-like mRNA interferase family)